MPISAPVNAARSIAKLLIRLFQVAKLRGTADAIRISSTSGRRQPGCGVSERISAVCLCLSRLGYH